MTKKFWGYPTPLKPQKSFKKRIDYSEKLCTNQLFTWKCFTPSNCGEDMRVFRTLQIEETVVVTFLSPGNLLFLMTACRRQYLLKICQVYFAFPENRYFAQFFTVVHGWPIFPSTIQHLILCPTVSISVTFLNNFFPIS